MSGDGPSNVGKGDSGKAGGEVAREFEVDPAVANGAHIGGSSTVLALAATNPTNAGLVATQTARLAPRASAVTMTADIDGAGTPTLTSMRVGTLASLVNGTDRGMVR